MPGRCADCRTAVTVDQLILSVYMERGTSADRSKPPTHRTITAPGSSSTFADQTTDAGTIRARAGRGTCMLSACLHVVLAQKIAADALFLKARRPLPIFPPDSGKTTMQVQEAYELLYVPSRPAWRNTFTSSSPAAAGRRAAAKLVKPVPPGPAMLPRGIFKAADCSSASEPDKAMPARVAELDR